MTHTRTIASRGSLFLFGILFLTASLGHLQAAETISDPSRNNIEWNSLGTSENDSMPIGNGDIAGNVWTEQKGDIVLLIAKSDAWSELGKLDKLARIRIHLSDTPFINAKDFTQMLHLESASIVIGSGANRLTIWVDANRPMLHVVGDFAHPTRVEAKLELWRNGVHPYNEPSPDRGGLFDLSDTGPKFHELPIQFAADTVLPASGNRLTWYHFNPQSIYPTVLKEQHLEQLSEKYPDPLLGRCFGATLEGTGLTAEDDHTLASSLPVKALRLTLVALTTTAPDTTETWQRKLTALNSAAGKLSLDQAWKEHVAWWTTFWNRSWIELSGAADTRNVEQGYVIQRYMMASSSRGTYPVKFNGGLFTVGGNVPAGVISTEQLHNPDYRTWGGAYWNQNQRQLYWPLLATGDFDLLQPWFNMYIHALPLARDRIRAYFHHDGAAFIETMNFWGLPTINDFGWGNSTNVVQSPYMRYHTQGGLEVVAQMLDEYDITQDAAFARKDLIPFADAILTYYAQHWKTDESGKLRIFPSQSIETYQVDATNPTPDIAGINTTAHRLLDLSENLTSQAQRNAWRRLLAQLPPLPIGTTRDGKLPSLAKGDLDGKRVVLPALLYGETKNVENPELYPVFPYRIFGAGKPELQLARDTYAARLFPLNYCWGQDGEESALLGLAEEARENAVRALTNYGNQRFIWFWNKSHDWIPDLDNGGEGMMTLQYMLLQTDGRRILLTPAWPRDWTADFKLHAPFQTTVEAHVEGGKVTGLKVTPESRRKDVEIVPNAE